MAPCGPVASAVMSAGRVSTGLVVSVTVRVNAMAEKLPEASVPVTLTT